MGDIWRMEENVWYVTLQARFMHSPSFGVLGEIVSCKLLGQIYIIINSERVANALLDRRSSLYSDRPVIQTSAL